MFGPLAAAAVSWVLTERTYTREPERLTALMIGAFGAKMVFFGAYVAVMLEAVGAAAGAVRRELHGLFHRACI